MTQEEYIQKLTESGEWVIYYDSQNVPDYAINEETNEMVIFQYGYNLSAEAKSFEELVDSVDASDNTSKRFVFEEIDRRIADAIDEYNKCLAHYTRTSSNINSDQYSAAKARLDTLLDLREEFTNENYW